MQGARFRLLREVRASYALCSIALLLLEPQTTTIQGNSGHGHNNKALLQALCSIALLLL